ncbi:MAG: hypothetical protein KDA96_11245, partial [Planctomycetaceae bacterium]|nr:hypothetical protein [Planctomycetaceae bacterium]
QEATSAPDTIPSNAPKVVIPYDPNQPALQADRVFVSYAEFLRLYMLADPGELAETGTIPLRAEVVAAYYKSDQLLAVDEKSHVAAFTARFVAVCPDDAAVRVELPMGAVAVQSVTVDGQPGTLLPNTAAMSTVNDSNESSQQAVPIQQQEVRSQRPALPGQGPGAGAAFAVALRGKGLHAVDVTFHVAVTSEGASGRLDLPLLPVAAGTMQFTLPAEDLDVKVNGRTNTFHRDGRTVILPIADASTIRVTWQPTARRVDVDNDLRAESATAIAVNDAELRWHSTIRLEARQGEFSEAEIIIPMDYAVQSVTGPDVAGWVVNNTDQQRFVRLTLQRAVSDQTSVTLQLYSSTSFTDERKEIPIPVPEVRGASTDRGTVVLLTGAQFQTGGDAISGVTRIDLSEAPMPDGDSLPGARQRAWRFTHHPAQISVRVSLTADEMKVAAGHAARMESQRILWASRFDVNISGTPRGRLDILVPSDFLPLEVDATNLQDWYLSPATDDGQRRVLSLQLSGARQGNLQIVIQGQRDLGSDRSRLLLDPPELAGTTEARSEIAVWLNAASENAGLEGGNWTAVPVEQLQVRNRLTSSSPTVPPSIGFVSTAASPGAATILLRTAVATMLAESVTATTMTPTSTDLILALKWQVTRAAADTFAVEVAESLANALTFEIPGLRRLTKEVAGDGRTRLIIDLQQPVSDTLFVIATGSLPLPSDGDVHPDPVSFVTTDKAPGTLSAQAHFWVLVNQSDGLLTPNADHKPNEVDPSQIRIAIPQELLEQQVTVQRLLPGTVSWKLQFPVQHRVTPAVVTLADHVTVLSDDGSWRSRHELTIRNDSRQFLPVQLPEGARILYCVVQRRPTRVVVHSRGEKQQHLIPIPQLQDSTEAFTVELGLAGMLGSDAQTIRDHLNSRKLSLPMPSFPDFRDDPEMGVTIARNRWSIYVPETWQASIVDDPESTNVSEADADELADVSIRSLLDQTSSFKGISSLLPGSSLSNARNKYSELSRVQGRSDSVERDRQRALEELGQIIADQEQLQEKMPTVEQDGISNIYLQQQELNQNGFNQDNRLRFLSGNSSGIEPANAAVAPEPAASAEDKFEFRLELRSQPESESREMNRKDAVRQAEPSQSAGKPPARGGRLKEQKFESSEASQDADRSKSQLLQRRAGAERVPNSAPPTAPQRKALEPMPPAAADLIQVPLGLIPQEMDAEVTVEQLFAAPELPRTPAATGTLSLNFAIPEEGQRLDFVRAEGNASLMLTVRSKESVSKGLSVVWAVICVVAAALLLAAWRRNQSVILFSRLCILTMLAGLAGWLILGDDIRYLSMLICLGAALLLTFVRFTRTPPVTSPGSSEGA